MNKHYLNEKEPHLGLVIILFGVMTVLFVLSGAWLFWQKTGFGIAGVIEYYAGSETALQYFPDMPDRFVNAKTVSGLLKSVLPHMLVYGLLVFIIVHLLAALMPVNRVFIHLLFVFGALDIAGGFPVLVFPVMGAWLRLISFFCFSGGILVASVLLIASVKRKVNDRGE